MTANNNLDHYRTVGRLANDRPANGYSVCRSGLTFPPRLTGASLIYEVIFTFIVQSLINIYCSLISISYSLPSGVGGPF